MAVRETHFKRRLAFSTVSNLSYILLGVTMMSPLGLLAGISHLIFHAVMKIGAFFCAGAVLHQSGREYVDELNGLGRKMPLVFGTFVIFGLSLTGIPAFCRIYQQMEHYPVGFPLRNGAGGQHKPPLLWGWRGAFVLGVNDGGVYADGADPGIFP